MNVTREEKKTEALARMKLWGIYAPIRKQFEKEDLVSESAPSAWSLLLARRDPAQAGGRI